MPTLPVTILYLSARRLLPCLALTVLLISASASRSARAQEAEAALGPQELIAEILELNPSLTARRMEAMAKEAEVSSAGALDDPRLSYSIAPATFGEDIPSTLGDTLGVRQVIQFSQTIPWPGKRRLRTESMQARADAAEFRADRRQLQLVAAGRSLWASWWALHEALSINSEEQELLVDLESVTETQYASGSGLQQDLLQVQTAQIQADHRQIVLEQQLRRTGTQINVLRDKPASTTIGEAEGEPQTEELPADETLRRWLIESHPALAAAQAEAEIARAERDLVYKDDFPDLQFNLGYNELWNESDLRFQAGISLNIPLDFGKRSSRKAASEYRYNSTLSDAQHLRNELLAELDQQLSSAEEAAHAAALASGELIQKAQQTLEAAQSDYQEGKGNFSDVIQAHRALLEARLLLANSRAKEYRAHAEIDRLIGGRLWPQTSTSP